MRDQAIGKLGNIAYRNHGLTKASILGAGVGMSIVGAGLAGAGTVAALGVHETVNRIGGTSGGKRGIAQSIDKSYDNNLKATGNRKETTNWRRSIYAGAMSKLGKTTNASIDLLNKFLSSYPDDEN